LIGAIAGDIIGSVFEWNNIKTTNFPLFSSNSRFTDDTVLTIALADSILNNVNYIDKLKEYTRTYPNAGYGRDFKKWAFSEDRNPYNSNRNGAAMRVSPVGFAYSTLKEVLEKAKESAEVTHNHPEGIKGAQATASSIFLAKNGSTKKEIKSHVETKFGYKFNFTLDEIRPTYTFDVSCQGSVPQAIKAFLESESYEHSIRLAISIGGDSDTIACINGGIAQAFYGGVPEEIKREIPKFLDDNLNEMVTKFCTRYNCY
jgi:ADP-ribosylglycohydrolase